MDSPSKRRWLIALLSIVLLTLVIPYPTAPALALGTPQITSINPPSPSPVGTCVTIRAKVQWDSDFRSMRMRFGNEGWQEEATPEFERTFCTGHLSPGGYTIRVEVARQGDNSWSNPTVAEASYELTSSAPPPPPASPTLTASPTSVSGGQSVTVSWDGLDPTGNDWISLHPAGTPDSSYLSWQYANGSSGSLAFAAPQDPGQYEFRLFRNGPKVATSNTFEVLSAPPPPPPPPPGPAISQVIFNPSGGAEVGQTVEIHVKVESSNPGAIRIFVPCGSVAHFEHTVPEYDTTWSTGGCGEGSQNVRVCARHVDDPNWENPTCTDRSYTLTPPPPPPQPAPTASFWANASSIQQGECTWLHWQTTNATTVDIDGTAVATSGDWSVCPTVTKHYSLKAVGPGGEATRSLSIVVSSSVPPPPPPPPEPSGCVVEGGSWSVGKVVGLAAGTKIYEGSGFGFRAHTLVPHDNWAVKIIGGPREANGWEWWDTSRKACDPSGGTGWVPYRQMPQSEESQGEAPQEPKIEVDTGPESRVETPESPALTVTICVIKPNEVGRYGRTIEWKEIEVRILGITLKIRLPIPNPRYQAYIESHYDPEPTRWFFRGQEVASPEVVQWEGETEPGSGRWQYGISTLWAWTPSNWRWRDRQLWRVEFPSERSICP